MGLEGLKLVDNGQRGWYSKEALSGGAVQVVSLLTYISLYITFSLKIMYSQHVTYPLL